MEPTRHRIPAHGVELCVFEWGRAAPGAPTWLLAHATGFHARCWDPVVRRLGQRHVVAVDQRGHGRSDKPEITHWNVFGRDLEAVVRALDLADVIGVGHSMGGHAMTEAAAASEDRFRRLVLVDPVISAPGDYRSEDGPRGAATASGPRRR
jgi:pimeloyl-ACP methyl ester carboxylesterase